MDNNNNNTGGNNRYAGMYPQPSQQQDLSASYKRQLDAAMALQHQINSPVVNTATTTGTVQQPPQPQQPARLKTRMCAYASGNCPYAARGKCFFAHSPEELREAGVAPQQQRQQRTPADPSKRKTRMCSYFLAGHCPYTATNSCTFAHSEQERQAALSQQTFQPQQYSAAALVGQQQQQYATSQPAGYAAYYNQIMLQHQQYAAAMAAAQQPASMQQQYQQLHQGNVYQQHQNYMTAYQQQWAAAQMMQQQQLPQQQQQPRQAPSPVYYKTRLCKFGDECPYQKNGKCRFAHSEAELRSHNAVAGEPPVPGTTAAVPQAPVHPLLQAATMPVAAPAQPPPPQQGAMVHPLLQNLLQPPAISKAAAPQEKEEVATSIADEKEEEPSETVRESAADQKAAREREEGVSDDEDDLQHPARRARSSLFVEAISKCARPTVLSFLSGKDADSFLEIISQE